MAVLHSVSSSTAVLHSCTSLLLLCTAASVAALNRGSSQHQEGNSLERTHSILELSAINDSFELGYNVATNTAIQDNGTPKLFTQDRSKLVAGDEALPRQPKQIIQELKHPQGFTRYLFYLYDRESKLIQRWLSLQEVQDILISHRIVYTPPPSLQGDGVTPSTQSTPKSPTPSTPIMIQDPVNPSMSSSNASSSATRPDVANIDGVIETIQKVMADEVANTPASEGNTLQESSVKPEDTAAPALLTQFIIDQISQFTTEQYHDTRTTQTEQTTDDYTTKTGTTSETFEADDRPTTTDVTSQENSKLSTYSFTGDRSTTPTEIAGYNSIIEDTTQTRLSDDYYPSYTMTPMSEIGNDEVSTISETVSTPSSSISDIDTPLTQQEHELISNLLQSNTHFSDLPTPENSDTDLNNSTSESTPVSKLRNDNVSPLVGNDILNSDTILDSYYYYDYPHELQFSNVLPPSQMATDAFKEDMNFRGENRQPPETEDDYYYDGPVYLDEETQDYYEKQSEGHTTMNLYNLTNITNPSMLDFPDPAVAQSYHPVKVSERPIATTSASTPQNRPVTQRTSTISDSSSSDQVSEDSTSTTSEQLGNTNNVLSGHEELESLGVSVRPQANILRPAPPGNLGLEASVANLSPKIKDFIGAMNNITFQVYKRAANQHRSRNFCMSALNLITVLSMLSLGSRGSTAGLLDNLLRTDDFRNFNPHLLLKNIQTEILDSTFDNNIAFTTNMFVEEPRRNSLQSLEFYRRTVASYYDTQVEQVHWNSLGSLARERVNDAVRNQTNGSIKNFLKEDGIISLSPPFSVVSSGLFQTSWKSPVTEKDLFDMSFIRFPTAERRLVRTVGISKRMTVLAGYSADHKATLAEIPLDMLGGDLSLVFVLPGQQKHFIANGLKQLEGSLTPALWSGLLQSMVPHTLNVQVPLFRHRSYTDVAGLLKLIGLEELFESQKADFSGVNGVRSLHLADVLQLTEFHSCRLMNSTLSFRSGGLDLSRMLNTDSHHRRFDYDVRSGSNEKRRSRKSVSEIADVEVNPKENVSLGKSRGDSPTDGSLISKIWSFLSSSNPLSKHRTSGLRRDDEGGLTGGGADLSSSSPLVKTYDVITDADVKSSRTSGVSSERDSLPAVDNNSSIRKSSKSVEEQIEAERSRDDEHYHLNLLPIEARSDDGPTVAFDRAFLYVVRHNPTGLILYIGRYLEPI